MIFFIGVNSNYFLSPIIFPYNIVPDGNSSDKSTSIKKRTQIQVQSEKANILYIETKTHIVTDFYISEWNIVDIESNKLREDEKAYLPSDKHPFDHLIVKAKIFIQRNSNT